MSKQSYGFQGFGAPPSVPQMPEQRRLFSIGPTGNAALSTPPSWEESTYFPVEMASAQAHNSAASAWSSRAGVRYHYNFSDTKRYSHSTTGLPLPPLPPQSFPRPSFPLPALPIPPIRPAPQVFPPAVYQWPPPPTPSSHGDGIALSLTPENDSMWRKFCAADTEMIVTKLGR